MDELQKKKTLIYVIDDDFHVIYLNNEMEQGSRKPEHGRICYKTVYNEQTQCVRCPLREDNKGKSIIFDKQNKEWLSVKSIPIEMPGTGKCSVITADYIENNGNDFLRGSDSWLYNKKCFFTSVEEVLKNVSDDTKWCILSVDIENLKLFNEMYGRSAGDELIVEIFKCLKKLQDHTFSVVGYFGNDDFALMIPYEEKLIGEIYHMLSAVLDAHGNRTGFQPVIGVYEIADKAEPAFTMYDRAELARMSLKGNYSMRIKKYNAEMMEKLQSQYYLYADIRKALKDREFIFFLQPKCNMENGKIIGAEALVRWESKEKGMISPGVFIPFLERTGFIAELDLYIWEEVCKWQRSIIDRGMEAVPVSVNVSRVDMYSMDVPAVFAELIQKYGLSSKMIEIEITESVYAEDNAFINSAIASLRKTGFSVLMDDFGSGYSSLNMLKDIEIDILKMDMRFLDINEDNANKGINILEAIFNMAAIMGIDVIVEGVETEAQKRFLLKMGGGYGQGYYFYRPIPVREFEKLIEDVENLDKEGIKSRKIEQLYLKDLLSEDMFSEVMINNMLGAVVFYEVFGEDIIVKRYNEHYASLFNDITFSQDMKIDFYRAFDEEQRRKLFQMFEAARRNRQSGADGDVCRCGTDGSYMWLHLRTFFLKEKDGHVIYYSSVRDVTDIYKKNEMLVQQGKELRFLNSDVPCGVFQYEADGKREFTYISNGLLLMLGYSREEFVEKFHNSFTNMVYEEDRDRVQQEIDEQIRTSNYDSCEYRIEMADGTLKWVYDRGQITTDAEGRRSFYVVVMDYDYLKKKENDSN